MNALELRDGGDAWHLDGPATTWGSPYQVTDHRGTYHETVARGAFSGATSGGDLVALRVEHGAGTAPLASTRGGSLSFSDAADGLAMTASLPKGEGDVGDAVAKVKRGVLDALSVGMAVVKETWSEDRSSRLIRGARLIEVSLVHAPANPGARVTSVRADEGEYEVRTVGSLAVVERATSEKYTPAQVEALGQSGKAFKTADGIYDYPAADRADVLAAIHRIGSAAPGDKAPLRRFIIARAKALGASRLVPSTWKPDGSVAARRSVPSPRELRAELGLPPDGTPGRVRNWQKILVSRTATPEERALAKNAIDVHYRELVRGMRIEQPVKRAEPTKRKRRQRVSIRAERELRRALR